MATAKLDTTELKEEFLNCSLCLEDFQDPRTLDCLHTFCFQCLETYAQSQGTKQSGYALKCPLCRSLTTIPENGFSALKKNHFVISLMDKANEKQKSNPCGLCNEGKPSIVLCLDCNLGLCEYCRQAHFKIRFFSDHRLVSNEDVQSGKYEEERKKLYPLCEEHLMPSDLYCIQECCKKVICIKCKVIKHEGHPTHTLAEQSTEIKTILEELQEDLSQKQSGLEEQLRKGEVTKDEYTKGLTERRKEMKDHIKQIVCVIEKEGELMVQNFDKLGEGAVEEITSSIAKIQTEVNEYSHIRSFIDQLLTHSSQYDLVNMAPTTMDRGRRLTKRVLLQENWKKWKMPQFQARDIESHRRTLKLIVGSTSQKYIDEETEPLSVPGEAPVQENPVTLCLWKEVQSSLPAGVLFKGKFLNNIEVTVCHGDITKFRADIIVNAANEHLNHSAGVARAIALAAGKPLVDECDRHVRVHGALKIGDVFPTTGGRLPCQYVFHAAGPRWNDYPDKQKCAGILRDTFYRCLVLANEKRLISIAIPALSSGIYGIPKPVVARAMYDATVSFNSAISPACYVKHVTYITVDHEVNMHIAHTFEAEGKPNPSQMMMSTSQNKPTEWGMISMPCGSSTTQSMHGDDWTDFEPSDGNQQINPTDWGKLSEQCTSSSAQSKYGDDWTVFEPNGGNQVPMPSATREANEGDTKTCHICLYWMNDPKVLPKCGHKFCRHCIDKSFKSVEPKCPTCGQMYGAIQGTQPLDGTMKVTKVASLHLPGCGNSSTFVIEYNIHSGIQTLEHPHPGKPYKGFSRKTFLPATNEGTEVLKLLQKAWSARLIFTIGRSLTTGRDDVVTWSGIHHKTSVKGGPSKFGFPDPDYLKLLRQELATKGIV